MSVQLEAVAEATPKNSADPKPSKVLRYEMSFCGSIKAVVLSRPEPVDQMPSAPVPAAAVDPACGLVRLGKASPVTVGVDAAAGALADVAALADVGALAATSR